MLDRRSKLEIIDVNLFWALIQLKLRLSCFLSNEVTSSAGLHAVYKQIDSPPSRCGGDMVQSLNLDNPEVSISSLAYPEKYNDRVRSR